MMIASLPRIRVRFAVPPSLLGASRLSIFRSTRAVGRLSLFSAAAWVVLGSWNASPAAAQSLVAGGIAGSVRDDAGRPIHEATVTLIDNATGVRRSLLTPRNGGVQFTLLLAADYDVLVERFGYAPRLVQQVPVRSGALVRVDVMLHAAAPDAAPDTVRFSGVPTGGVQLALTGGADADFADLSGSTFRVPGLGDLLPGAGASLNATGLPGRLGAIGVDGVTRWSPRHARLVGADLDGIAFPFGSMRGVQMPAGVMDAEWPGAGGGVLAGFTTPGARRLSFGASALAGPDVQHALAMVSGPIVRDTAQFALGIAITRLAPQYDAPWPVDSAADTSAAAAMGIAQDSFQTDLGAYRRPYTSTSTVVSGFGRLDWTIAQDHRLSVRASAASMTNDQPDLGSEAPVLGSTLTARDVSASVSLASVFGHGVGNELRVALDAGSRDYTAAGLARTLFVDGGFTAGSADLQPGAFKRTTFRFAETVHYRLPFGLLKGGVQIGLNTFDQTYAEGRSGSFYFGDSTGFATATGFFRQTVGSSPVARFKTMEIGAFVQALLRPSRSLEVIVGVRRDEEHFPVDQIRANTAWTTATGIDNTAVRAKRNLIMPRLGLTWTLGAARQWQVTADGGQFAEAADPGQFAEAITHATGVQVRRGAGAFGAWPHVPDSTTAPVQGNSLTLLGPQYVPPRTNRVLFGISGNVSGTILRLAATYRHTDFLPVRRDLNLSFNPRARDQDGRVLYGPLTRMGTALAAVPGSNRRFSGFDEVSSLDPVGASDYWGFSVGFERLVGRGIEVMASYTYSRTTDNWFGARSGSAEAQFVPLVDTAGASPWADGRSDFDTPHRVVFGTALHFGHRARLAALFRWRSGAPFTPGFRDGVDANGDGSARNDPAFVNDVVTGTPEIIAANACLSAQVGAFAQRNSCRDPAQTSLDLRFAITLGRPGGLPAELLFDALGVVRGGTDMMDHALYLIDAAGTLTTNATTGVTTVPLRGNPNFGRVLARRDAGTVLRAGLRVGL